MSERNRLLQAIATIIEDYQAGILAAPTPAHVERWINQFPQDVQQPILAEMEHVLAKAYFSKSRVRGFLKSLIHHAGWTGGDPAVAAYVASLGKEQKWRTGSNLGPQQFFSSHQGRHLLEQEFLKMGVAVRARPAANGATGEAEGRSR